jgi:hypothetical protein
MNERNLRANNRMRDERREEGRMLMRIENKE